VREKGKFPTLTIRGFIVYCTDKVNDVIEQKFDWENALIDAAVTSAVTFFSALGGGTATGLDGEPGLEAAAIAAFAQFFVFLALKRGIVQPKEAQRR
jgi:hypothetical protein